MVQNPDDIDTGDERLPHPSEGFDDRLVRSVLEIVGDVELERGGAGETEMFEDQDEEDSKIP
jgi:hypothetical protein